MFSDISQKRKGIHVFIKVKIIDEDGTIVLAFKIKKAFHLRNLVSQIFIQLIIRLQFTFSILSGRVSDTTCRTTHQYHWFVATTLEMGQQHYLDIIA